MKLKVIVALIFILTLSLGYSVFISPVIALVLIPSLMMITDDIERPLLVFSSSGIQEELDSPLAKEHSG